jgi:hypothetical protein
VVTPTSEKTVLRDENATIKFARANGVQVEFKMLPLEQFSVLFKRHGFTTIDMLSIEHASSDRSASSHTQTESDSLRMYLLCTPCARRHGVATALSHGGLNGRLADALHAMRGLPDTQRRGV